MPSLMDKLRMIDSSAKPAPQPAKSVEAHASCYHTSEAFPLSLFCDFKHASAPILEQIYGFAFPRSIAPTDMLFLDTETTGLSGGVGTLAFEVGVGYISGDRFVVEQFMMRDYPEEQPMLERVAKLLGAFPVLVTFNGRTFDAPLLKSRMLMNRIPSDCLTDAHADLLHPARRLWKLRLGRCTLQRLESAVLGVEREDDLPGEFVPQTYFRFLKDGDFAPLERILDHNRQDIVSLAQLFFFLCKQYDQPEVIGEDYDLFSLAKALEKRGDTVKATKCYRLCAHGSLRPEAYTALARQQKRAGNAETAARLYSAMLRRGERPIDAYESLAKLYEHQLRQPEQALAFTRQALLLLSEPTLSGGEAVQERRNALQYRYARLRRKLAGANKEGSSWD